MKKTPAYKVPEVGDTVVIQSEQYSGEAMVTYILQEYLFIHSFHPIQCEISEENLHKRNDGDGSHQCIYRTNLREIVAIQSQDDITILDDDGDLDDFEEIVGTQQGSLFDF